MYNGKEPNTRRCAYKYFNIIVTFYVFKYESNIEHEEILNLQPPYYNNANIQYLYISSIHCQFHYWIIYMLGLLCFYEKNRKNTDAEGEWSEWNEVIKQLKRLLGTEGKKEKKNINLMICKVKWTMYALNTIRQLSLKYLFALPSNHESIIQSSFRRKILCILYEVYKYKMVDYKYTWNITSWIT